MANKWIEALKKYNEKKGNWCVPKKGTKEYDEVRKIMDGERESKTKTRTVEVKRTRRDEYYDDMRPRRGKKTITYFRDE